MLVIMLTCGAVLLLDCAILGFYQIYKFHESLVLNTTVLADVLARNTQAALAFRDEAAAQQTLQALQADSYVTGACLYSDKRARFAKYIRQGERDEFPAEPPPDGRKFGVNSLAVVRPVMLNERRIGTIYLSTDLAGLYERLRLFAGFSFFVLMISGAAAFVLSARLQRPISQPIHALTEMAHRISADGDFAQRVPAQGRDEVGQLTAALNQLLASIEERDKALRAANELLRGEVSERTAAEKELAASEQRLKALMQALPVGVSFSYDRTCEHISGNAAMLAQIEASPEDNMSASTSDLSAHGRRVKYFVKGRAIAADELPLQRAVAENREVKPMEYETVLPSGRHIFLEGSGAPIRDEQGNASGGVAVTVDITERKQAENTLKEIHAQLADRATQLETLVEQRTVKLRETIAELEAFSYSIAHDMRAPLRALQGFSEILLGEYSEKLDAEGQRFLQRISASADRMDRLIQDVLSYSRVVRSDFPLEPVDVSRLLRGILDTYPLFAAEKADIVIAEPIPTVLGNEAMLTQIFSNFIGNAVKFVAPGVRPHLKIWAEAQAKQARIFVEDNGIGIEPDQCEKIFAIFQRVSKNYEGTGIGLAIVKKAVERMGGKVGVESKLGHGSTFWVEVQKAPGVKIA
jgi:signal transduction histidine kinase